MSEPSSSPPESAGISGRKTLTNLQIRILSAIALGLAVLALVWLGGAVCRVLAAIVGGIIFYEWAAMRKAASGHPAHHWVAGVCVAVPLVALVLGFHAWILFGLTALAVVVTAADGYRQGLGGWNAAGLAYAAVSAITLAFIRGDSHVGLLAILFLFAVVWATDALAYFVGRAVGGPKLAPKISPGKTWSGAIGGAAGGVAAGVLFAASTGWGSLGVAAVALLLSVVSQFGDLFESFLKRRQGVKDSSRLIPGHGGLMDRVDGLVAAGWALYLIGVSLAGPDNPASGLVGG